MKGTSVDAAHESTEPRSSHAREHGWPSWARRLFGSLVGIAITAFVAYKVWPFVSPTAATPPGLDTPYQAVLLTNGAIYFGKLEGLGKPFPVLTDVFYIQSMTNDQTKQATSVLVKRGREPHAPDRMVLNASHIVLIEPVGRDSRVAQLIVDAKR